MEDASYKFSCLLGNRMNRFDGPPHMTGSIPPHTMVPDLKKGGRTCYLSEDGAILVHIRRVIHQPTVMNERIHYRYSFAPDTCILKVPLVTSS